LAPLSALLVVLFIVDLFKGSKERRLIIQSIQKLDKMPPDSDWFDKKVRAYHNLRDK
jgi:hypothetical protein